MVEDSSAPMWIGADELVRRVPPSRARELLRAALVTGLDPSSDPPRTIIEAERGQLLLMPSAGAKAVGTKVVGLARDNPARGLPTIQAVYVLMDAETLTPQALIDGIALTNLRTPAVSAVALAFSPSQWLVAVAALRWCSSRCSVTVRAAVSSACWTRCTSSALPANRLRCSTSCFATFRAICRLSMVDS